MFYQLVAVSSSSKVGGAIGGVFIALIIILVVLVIAVIVLKYRRRYIKEAYTYTLSFLQNSFCRKYDTNIRQTAESISYSLKLRPSVNDKGGDEERYIRRGGPMVPLDDKSTYVISNKAPGSPTSPTNPYTSFFDDPTYEAPSVVITRKKKLATLSKTDSKENLLGDEEEVEAPPPLPDRTTSLKPNEKLAINISVQ